MSHDIISDTLNNIMNAKKAGKKEIVVNRYSNFLIEILEIAKKHKYLDYSLDTKNKKLRIQLTDVSECRTIKPRYYVKKDDIEKYARRFLPARNVGIMIISTSSGLMTQEEIYEKNIGGCLVAYFY